MTKSDRGIKEEVLTNMDWEFNLRQYLSIPDFLKQIDHDIKTFIQSRRSNHTIHDIEVKMTPNYDWINLTIKIKRDETDREMENRLKRRKNADKRIATRNKKIEDTERAELNRLLDKYGLPSDKQGE